MLLSRQIKIQACQSAYLVDRERVQFERQRLHPTKFPVNWRVNRDNVRRYPGSDSRLVTHLEPYHRLLFRRTSNASDPTVLVCLEWIKIPIDASKLFSQTIPNNLVSGSLTLLNRDLFSSAKNR